MSTPVLPGFPASIFSFGATGVNPVTLTSSELESGKVIYIPSSSTTDYEPGVNEGGGAYSVPNGKSLYIKVVMQLITGFGKLGYCDNDQSVAGADIAFALANLSNPVYFNINPAASNPIVGAWFWKVPAGKFLFGASVSGTPAKIWLFGVEK